MNGSQLEVFQGFYDNITATVGCNASNDSLACLRTVPFDNLYNASVGFIFKPLLDGRFLSQRPWNNMEVDVATIEPVESTHGHEEKSLPAWDVVAARSDSAQKLPRR